MKERNTATNSKNIDIQDLKTQFLSLRIGEEIPRLEIKQIRKITDPTSDNNLSGVDYKYLIEAADGKILTINTWSFWKKISAILQKAGKIQVTLELKHPDVDDYRVRIV